MINTKAFCSALKFAAHAMATQDVRYYLKGVRFEFTEKGLVLVGCDGARLATVTLPAHTGVIGNFIVASDSVKQILSTFGKDKLGEIIFSVESTALTLSNMFGATYTPTLVDGVYPDWKRIVPPANRAKGSMPQIDPVLLGEACKALAPLCGKFKGAPSVRFDTAGEGHVVAITPPAYRQPSAQRCVCTGTADKGCAMTDVDHLFMTPREREVERALVQRVEAAGGLAWKFTSPGRRGVPDRVVMLPGRAPEFVELKRKGQKPRADQLRQHKRMRAAGAIVHVIDDEAGIDLLLKGGAQ